MILKYLPTICGKGPRRKDLECLQQLVELLNFKEKLSARNSLLQHSTDLSFPPCVTKICLKDHTEILQDSKGSFYRFNKLKGRSNGLWVS